MQYTVENTTASPAEIGRYFDRLQEHIEMLKAATPWDGNGTYSPLQQAAYHLCQCRSLVENFEESSRRRKQNGTKI